MTDAHPMEIFVEFVDGRFGEKLFIDLAEPTQFGLTTKEAAVLGAIVRSGIEVNGAATAAELIEDNVTGLTADDLQDALGWSKQEIGGVMSALSEKGLIVDTGESPRGAACTDWFAADTAIHWYFDN